MLQRISGYFFIILFVGMIGLLLYLPPKNFFKNPGSKNTPPSSEKIFVQQSIKKIFLSDTSANGTNWELWADSARSDEESSSWIFEGVKVNFYRNKAQSKYTVKADVAQFDIKEKNMYFEKNILLTSPNDYIVKAKVLNYFQSKGIIESPKPINLFSGKKIQESLKLNSKAIVLDIKESEINLTGVSSFRQIKKRGPVSITSDFATILGGKNTIEYKENVKFKGMDIFMESGLLNVALTRRTKSMRSILAKKNVHVVSENRHAYSQRAFIDVPAEIITMSQSPRLKQQRDMLFGEKIIFYNKTKIVSVKKARAKVDKQGVGKYNESIKSN